MSEEKTLITHARTGAARFLGYEIAILQDDAGRDQAGKRTINGQIALRVPKNVIREKCKPYLRGGRPAHRTERTHDSVYDIVVQHQSEYRGVAEYYKLAYNRTRLGKLRYTMEVSLTKTLAAKLRTSVRRVYRRYGATIVNEHGTYKGLEVNVERDDKPPLVARWGGISLKRTRWTDEVEILNDSARPNFTRHSELIDRLLRDTCELCGSREKVQMHHIRKLSDLKKRGRTEPPRWVIVMANRCRKTLAVCHECHVSIHAGRIQRPLRKDTGEPDAGKLASPVRRGADGKVSSTGRRS